MISCQSLNKLIERDTNELLNQGLINSFYEISSVIPVTVNLLPLFNCNSSFYHN